MPSGSLTTTGSPRSAPSRTAGNKRQLAEQRNPQQRLTGIPLWFPSSWGTGLLQWSRFIHHVVFLLTVAGFIIHVLLSALMFPGTMDGMTSGRVSTAWAAHHHPRWFREQRDVAERMGEAETAT